MSIGKLYYSPSFPRSNWMPAFVKELKLDIECIPAKESLDFKVDFPLGMSPGFVDKYDFHLSETVAICQYLAELSNSPLSGANAKERAELTRWCSFINNDCRKPILLLWLQPEKSAEERNAASLRVKGYIQYLDDHLKNSKFIAGDRYTWGDIFCSYSVLFFCKHIEHDFEYKNIDRWVKDVEKVSVALQEVNTLLL